MSEKKQGTTQNSDKLLTAEERLICQKIAALDLGLSTQRAATLIDLDDGLTRAKTSDRNGLSLGQIRYLISTFQQKRLAMFTDDVLSELQPSVQGPSEEIAEASKVVVEEKKEKKAKKDKKEKAKTKKVKAKKKTKKSKKAKKSKSSKKSKNKKSKAKKKK